MATVSQGCWTSKLLPFLVTSVKRITGVTCRSKPYALRSSHRDGRTEYAFQVLTLDSPGAALTVELTQASNVAATSFRE